MSKKSNVQKYILFILVSVFIMGTLSGCADNPKTFTQQELTITLTDAFKSEKEAALTYIYPVKMLSSRLFRKPPRSLSLQAMKSAR